jgi:hypothetical protein
MGFEKEEKKVLGIFSLLEIFFVVFVILLLPPSSLVSDFHSLFID